MATWAKGIDFKNSANTIRVGGVGIYGTDTASEKLYIGLGSEPWNNNGLQITSSSINFKGNKVYHAGDKPTPADIGAAASSHTHSYLPLSGGTVTGETIFNNYLSVNAWPNYGSGRAQIWFNGNTKALTLQSSTTDILIGSNYVYHQGRKPSASDVGAAIINRGSHKWTCSLSANTWSRILFVGGSSLGSGGIIGITGTRNSVVYSNTFVFNAAHPGKGNITQLSGGRYSQLKIRLVVNNNGDCYVEAMDSADQSIVVTFMQFAGSDSITKFSAATSGATLPSGYNAVCETTMYNNGINAESIKVNGYEVYHPSNKPSLSDLGAAAASHNHDGVYMKQANANGYYGMTANGDTSNWVRTTVNGIIPYQSGGASSLGTSSWPFTNIYANNIYDNGTLLENKFAPYSHTHNYAGSSSAGGAATTALTCTGNSATATTSSYLGASSRMDYGWNGVNYFNISGTAGAAAKANDTPSTAWWHIMRFNHANGTGYYTDLAVPFNDVSLYYKRITAGSVQNGGWIKVLDSLNYNSYAPTKTGGGASGTWGISVSGNSATTTKLATARTLTIGNTGKNFDGTRNVAWSLAEIGAAASNHSHSDTGFLLYRGGVSNFDTRTGVGVFSYTTTETGRPNDYGSVLQWANVSNPTPGTVQHWITQLASGTNNNLYYRTRTNDGAWNGWSTIWHSRNFDPNSKANSSHDHNRVITSNGGGIYEGNGDAANSTNANVQIKSWWGIGFAPSISGQGVPQNQNAVWMDVRNGHVNCRGNMTANGTMYARGAEVVAYGNDGGRRHWVRFYDGTQICWGEDQHSTGDLNMTGASANNVFGGVNKNLYFPVTFTTKPAVSISVATNGYTDCQATGITTSYFLARAWNNYATTVSHLYFSWVAIGRWK